MPNLSGFPEPFKPLREPLRTLIGRYESGMLRGRRFKHSWFKDWCETIEGFFYDHPKAKKPEQILIVDVEDWRLAMEERFSPNTVRSALCALKAFYSWLREESGYLAVKDGISREVEDPVVIPKPRPRSLVAA